MTLASHRLPHRRAHPARDIRHRRRRAASTRRPWIARRPRVADVAEWFDADRRAVPRMQRVRDRHRPGPVVVRLPGRTVALIVDPDHLRRVLDQSPETFSTANREKWAALASFQPHGVLISDPDQRAQRRPFNERVLDTD